MPLLLDELTDILDGRKLIPYFQPIVSISRKRIIGYEALIRGPADSPLHAPLPMFDTAERFDLSEKLEFACREVIIQRYARLGLKEKLFLNISPSVLLKPNFKPGETIRFLERYGVDARSVVIEITEHQPTDDYRLMRNAVMHYRDMGFEIALDDLGAGYSGLRLWSELLPDYVKIDKHFIRELHEDPIKLNFVRYIQNMASALNCRVIAEGVESPEEYQAIEKLGIRFAQGYYFAEPMPIPSARLDSALWLNNNTKNYKSHPFSSSTISRILKIPMPVSSETPITEVWGLFQRDSELTVLPLVDQDQCLGIVFRDGFFNKLFSSRYGIELYGKKPIKLFIDKTPLSFDKNTSLELVSRQLTEAMREDPAFIITENGKYKGIGTLLDLLEEMTLQKIHNAKHANPLTLLPGSVPVNEQINQLLANKIPFGIGYFDLDNFKPFNDAYGYSAGDDIIKAVAATLTRHVFAPKGRVGHIGGDDFIVIFTCNDWLKCCKNILEAFKNTVPAHYKDEDRKAGGIRTFNRAGEICFFPMISLSVGLVDPESVSHCQSHVDIADLASEAKKRAKLVEGNSYFINRAAPAQRQEEFGHAAPLPS